MPLLNKGGLGGGQQSSIKNPNVNIISFAKVDKGGRVKRLSTKSV